MNGRDEGAAALTPVEGFALDVVLLTRDEALARAIGDVCRRRGHRVTRVDQLRQLGIVLPPVVLVLDLGVPAAEAARIAATLAAIHEKIPIVLAAERRLRRSESGFRVLDKRWSAERLVDELELAYIGIPAEVGAGSS